MNYKVVLGVLGVSIVIGGIVYLAAQNSTEQSSSNAEGDDKRKRKNDIVEVNVSEKSDISHLDDIKAEASEEMKERHEKAHEVMREAVDNIFNGAPSKETENEETKNKLFEDLGSI